MELPIYSPKFTPYSTARQGVVLRPLNGGFWYAFNYENPAGIKFLRGETALRLSRMLANDPLPSVNAASDAIEESLVWHGLLRLHQELHTNADTEATMKQPNTLNIWLHVVNGCNFSCFYCYIPHLDKAISPGDVTELGMSAETAFPVLHQLVAYCEKHGITQLHVKFAGGEPTLNIQLIDQFCNEHDPSLLKLDSFGMISNGYFDIVDVLPILQAHGITLSTISRWI